MIRTLTATLLTILLLLACLPAMAGEIQIYGLYQGEEVAGTAVLLGDGQTLLTALDAARVTEEVTDGTENSYVPSGMTSDGYAALLHFDAVIGTEPLMIASAFPESGLVCMGAGKDGSLVRSEVRQVMPYRFNGHAAVVFSGEEGLVPGAALMDEQGNVAGLVVACYGEGRGRYVAYTNEGLFFALSEIGGVEGNGMLAPKPIPATIWIADPVISLEDCVLTVDWSASQVLDLAEDSVFTVFMQDVMNPFYIYITAAKGSSSCKLAAAPGRVYAIWVRHDHGEADLTETLSPDVYSLFGPEPVTAFDRYDYADESIWLSAVPAGTEMADTETLPAAETLTADLFNGNCDVYMQVVSHYQVTEQLESSLYISLVGPDGVEAGMLSGFIFAPEYMEHDAWHAPVTELFDVMRQYSVSGELAPGEYTIAYYLYGEVANSFTFTLE